MDIEIETSDPDNIDPGEIADALTVIGYYVHSIHVGDVYWHNPDCATE